MHVSGWLVAFTESIWIHLIDPFTLETKHTLNINDAKHKPDTLGIMTTLAHGFIDQNGDFWNMGSGLDLEHKIPTVAYFALKIPGAGRPSHDRWSRQVSAQAFLDSIEFSAPTHNSNPLDYQIRYFHFLSGSENYLILPLNSLMMHLDLYLNACANAKTAIEVNSTILTIRTLYICSRR